MADTAKDIFEHPVYEQAVSALQLDAERHRQRLETSLNYEPLDCSLNEDKQTGAGSRFRKAHRRLALVQRLGSVGVRNKHIKQFGKLFGRGIVRSQESENFLGRMLNSAPLMSRATEVLEMFHHPLFGANAACDKSHVFGLIAQSLHDIKKATIMASWLEHVKPLKDELFELSVRHSSLKDQFREARSTYLKEVSELRDTVRVRGDPMMALDIVYFHEPTHSLEHEERKFLLDVMREKFKMMVENNPMVVKTFDFGQMEKLIEQVENHECTLLRESLKRKSEEITQLRQAVAWDDNKQRRTGSCVSASKSESGNVIHALTLQVEELRNKQDDISHKLLLSAKQVECLQTERDELAAELRSELAVKSMLQDECEQLRMKIDQLEEAKTGLERAVDKQSHSLHAGEDKIKSLQATLQRYCGRTGLPRMDFMFSKATADDTDNIQPPLSEDDSVARADIGENSEVEELREQCLKLQELVRMHLEEQSRTHTERASEEAEHFIRVAGSLGCMENGSLDCDLPDGIRVCKCSNLLMEDSKFCRKCGQEWKSPTNPTRHQVIASLSVQLANSATQLEDAIKNLNEELNHKQDSSRGPHIAEAERKVTQLMREQKGFETRLIMERSAQSFEEIKPLLELETCNCNCFQELQITMDMMKQLQVLCAEMTVKVREAANDNMQLNSALDSTLVALGSAKRLINRSKTMQEQDQDEDLINGVQALIEAEHSCVFHRLFNPNSETKDKWKRKKRKLMTASAEALGPAHRLVNPNPETKEKWNQRKKIDLEASVEAIRPALVMDTDPQRSPIFAAVRTPSRKRPSALRHGASEGLDNRLTGESDREPFSVKGQRASAKEGFIDAERLSEQVPPFSDERSTTQTDLGEFSLRITESTLAPDERFSTEGGSADFPVQAQTSTIKASHSDKILSMENASGGLALTSPKYHSTGNASGGLAPTSPKKHSPTSCSSHHSPTSCGIRRTMYRRGVGTTGQASPGCAPLSHLSSKKAVHSEESLTVESDHGDLGVTGRSTNTKEEALESIRATCASTGLRRSSISLPIKRPKYKSEPGKSCHLQSPLSMRAKACAANDHHHHHHATDQATFHSEGSNMERQISADLTVAGHGASASQSINRPDSGHSSTFEEEAADTSKSALATATCPRRNSISFPVCRLNNGKASHIVSTHIPPPSPSGQPTTHPDDTSDIEHDLLGLVVEGRHTEPKARDSCDDHGRDSSPDVCSPRFASRSCSDTAPDVQASCSNAHSSPRFASRSCSDTAPDVQASCTNARALRAPQTPRVRPGKQAPEDLAVVSGAGGLAELKVFTHVDNPEKALGHRLSLPANGSRRRSSSGHGTHLPPMLHPESKPRMLVTSSRGPSPSPKGSGASSHGLHHDPDKTER